mgnify:CR=1 FL=1
MKLKDEICFDLMTFIRKTPNEVVIPNFYFGFYEMDVFRLTPSGFVTEYEIKTSRADLKNDFKKSRFVQINPKDPNDKLEIFKHEEIEKGSHKANKFIFVVPDGLVKPEEIPKYCGLIYFKKTKTYKEFKVVQIAKFLHKNKFEESGFKDLCKSLSWREMSIRLKNVQQKKEIDKLKKLNNN